MDTEKQWDEDFGQFLKDWNASRKIDVDGMFTEIFKAVKPWDKEIA